MAFRTRASTPSGAGSPLTTVDGDMVNRSELFDEADLDAAIARFDELQPASARDWKTRQAKWPNAFGRYFAARDWDAMARDYWPTTFPRMIAVGW